MNALFWTVKMSLWANLCNLFTFDSDILLAQFNRYLSKALYNRNRKALC